MKNLLFVFLLFSVSCTQKIIEPCGCSDGYSLKETKTCGVWVDGKAIYRKTVAVLRADIKQNVMVGGAYANYSIYNQGAVFDGCDSVVGGFLNTYQTSNKAFLFRLGIQSSPAFLVIQTEVSGFNLPAIGATYHYLTLEYTKK
ncbi:MAG: hypothetical protein ACRC78_15115 [Planktothrix sp.]